LPGHLLNLRDVKLDFFHNQIEPRVTPVCSWYFP
jgi:hypothetical protein